MGSKFSVPQSWRSVPWLFVQLRRTLVLALLGFVSGLLVACSPSSDHPEATGQVDAFQQRIAAYIAEAGAGGASTDQLALLSQARAEGAVTVEITRQARRAYSECAANIGVDVTFTETTRPDGWVSVMTRVQGDGKSDPMQAAADCERQEAQWVTQLYDTQPLAEQATADYLEQQAPALRSCLEAAGFEPEPDATGMDLAILSTQAADSSMRDLGSQCFLKIGISGF